MILQEAYQLLLTLTNVINTKHFQSTDNLATVQWVSKEKKEKGGE